MSDDAGLRPGPPARRPWVAVALVLGLALGVRLGYVLTLEEALVWDDARHYDRIAWNFLQGDGLGLDEYHRVVRPPLYSLLLAGLYLVNYHLHLTSDILLVRLAQVLISSATVALIWWSARRLFGGRSAFFAALLAALYPFFVYYVGVLLSETLAIFLVALALAALVAMWQEKALLYPVAAGATLGLLCLTRSSFLLLPLLVALVWVAVRQPRRRAVLEAVLMLVIWAGVLVPWVARNHLVTHGRFVPGTLTAGWSLYEAAGPGADGGPRMEHIQWPDAVWPREASSLDEYQADRYVSRLALEHMRRQPVEAARLAVKKLARLWNVVPNFEGFRSPLYLVVSVLGYVPVMVLALIAVVARRHSWRRWLVLVVPVVYLSAIHSVFVGSIRYRVPAMVGLLVLAGAGAAAVLGRWWGRGSGGRRRRWWLWLLLVVGVLLVLAFVGLRVLLRPESVEARLRDELARLWGARVTVGRARFRPLRGVEARHVVLYSAQDPQRPILKVERLRASHESRSLARGRLVVTDVDIKVGELLLRRTSAGWDLPEGLLERRPRPGARPPRISVRGLRLRLQEQTQDGWRETELGRLNLRGRSQADGAFGLDFSLQSDVLGEWQGQATVSGEGDRLGLSASCAEFHFSPESLAALPEAVERVLRRFAPEGTASLKVSAEVPLNGEGGSQVSVEFAGPSLAYDKFPYRLPWTRGKVHLSEGRATVTEAEGGDGEVRASITGTISLPGHPRRVALRLEVTKGRLDEKLRDCLPQRYHGIWNDLSPSGTFNLTGRITADESTQGRTEVALEAEPLGCTLDYVRFPYPVRLKRGTVRYERGRLEAVGLEGEARSGVPVALSGTVEGLDTPRPQPHILIESSHLPLDAGLRQALEPRHRELWDRLQPEGEVAARCLILRADDGEGPVAVEVTAELLGASITDREFPYRLSELRGRLTYTGTALVLEEVQGRHGPARVSLSGKLLPGPPAEIELQVRGEGVPLDADLKQALPPRVREVWSKLDLQGTVDVVCELTGPVERPRKTIKVTTRKARACYQGFPYPFENLKGELEYKQEEDRLEWLLRGGKESIVLSTDGRIDNLSGQPTAEWGVKAENLQVDDVLLRAIEQQPLVRRLWQYLEVKPGPAGDLACSLTYREGRTVVERVEVELKKARVRFGPIPYPFDEVTGIVIYEPGFIGLKGLRGQRAGGWLEVVVGLISNPEGEPSFQLGCRLQDLPVDETLRQVLPAGHQDLWDQLDPFGHLSSPEEVRKYEPEDDWPSGPPSAWGHLKFPNFPEGVFMVSGGPTGPRQRWITYSGELELRDVGFTLGMEFEGVTGELSLAGLIEAEVPAGDDGGREDRPPYRVVSHRYGGTARLDYMMASNKELKNVTGSFRKEGTMLGFFDVKADMYGGRLEGLPEEPAAVRLELGPEVSYGCRLRLEGVDLDPFVRATFNYQGEELVGKLSSPEDEWVVLQGVGADRRDLVGQGVLTITEGELYRMPLLLRILSLLQLSPPRESAFSKAVINYYVIDQELIINELSLWGRGLNIFGSGRVTRTNQLDLTLYSGFGRGQLPHVPLLSDVVELLGKQLVRLRVEGTFGEPEVTVEPLSPLSGPLISIFRRLTRRPLTAPADHP